jgi:N4-gp56 family major capsid protein
MAFTNAINTSLLTTYLIRKFIPALEKDLQMQRFTTKAMVPPGQGNVGRFNVFSSPSAATSFIAEGTTTAGEITTLTTTPTNVTIREYGQFIKMTRLNDLSAVKGSRDEVANRLAYAAALTIDGLVYTRAKATTSKWFAGHGTTVGATDAQALSVRDIIGASLDVLRTNSARGFSGVAGLPDDELAAVVHPAAEADMVSEAATSTNKVVWSEIVKHVPGAMGQEKAIKGAMGSVYGTACFRSQNIGSTGLTTNTAYDNVVFAEGGVGSVALEDMDPVIYVNTPSSGDVGNPYRNFSTIAWHIFYGDSLIDSNRVVRLYSAI